MPPRTANEWADCVGAISDNLGDYSLFTSPHILWNVKDKLVNLPEFQWSEDWAQDYAETIEAIVLASQGAVVDPTPHVTACKTDEEDNKILDLVDDVGAILLVTDDYRDLHPLDGWQGVRIMSAADFAFRVERERTAGHRPSWER